MGVVLLGVRKRWVVTLSLLFLMTGSAAMAAGENRITFTDAGPLGNFDADMAVDNTLAAPNGGVYGTHSYTWRDTDGLFQVRNYLGFAFDSSPRHLYSVGQLNSNHRYNDPIEGNIGWAHETSTVAYNPTTKKWVFFWMTFPKKLNDTPYDENLVAYGWIGRKTADNVATSAHPDPNLSTLSTHETRMWKGTGYTNRLQATTDSWATGDPVLPPFPAGSPSYLAFAEPGATYVGNTLYLIVAAHRQSGSSFPADLHLFKSTNDGTSWTHVKKVLDASVASQFNFTFSYFTAPSLYTTATGKQRLMVTPSNFLGSYRGVLEFEFTDINTGNLVLQNNKPKIFNSVPDNYYSGHFGAGSWHPGLNRIQFSKHVDGQTDPFRVFEYVP